MEPLENVQSENYYSFYSLIKKNINNLLSSVTME